MGSLDGYFMTLRFYRTAIEYNEQIIKCSELDSVLLPIEDGIMFSVKL